MKALSPALQAHLDDATTTLAWCWKITRADGVTLGFTDHDRVLAFGGTDYEPESGFSASEIRAGSDLAVDAQDAEGALSSGRITETDIIDGRWDNALVEVWRVNWRDPAQRVLLRRGSIGELRRGRVAFVAEMRSMAHVLGQTVGRVYQGSCDAALGDARCGVDLDDPAYRGAGAVIDPVRDRAFAEQMLVHENAVVKIDKDLPLDRAALVGCGVLTGFGAVTNAAQVEPGSTVVVIGCGGVGLSAVSGAALTGAGRIIAVDMLDTKLDLAKKLGATDVINAKDTDPVASVMEMTKGGAHYTFEALGMKRTATQAFDMLRPGGTATLIGMFKPGEKLEFEGSMFIKDRKIRGSSMGSNRFRVDIPNILNYYRQGRMELDHLISSHIPLTHLNEAFANLRTGGTVRQVVDFSL